MQCEHAQRALSDARYAPDGDGAEELRAHLAGCAACRAVQAQHAQIDRWLALAEPAAPSADFDARFFARLAAERARGRRRRWVAVTAAALPIAAAVAIAVLRGGDVAPEPAVLAQLPVEDVELAVDLDLVEDLDVVEHLDEIEAYEVLADVDEAELERILAETK